MKTSFKHLFRYSLLPLLLLAGCGPKPEVTEAKAEVAVPVTVAPVQIKKVDRTLPANGTLYAYEDVIVSPKVDGRVIAIHADVGDLAIPGSLLLELDPTDFDLAVNEARRALDAELARIGLAEIPTGEFDVAEVPIVQKAEAARANAVKTFERIKSSGSISKPEFDAAETEMKVGEANKKDAVTIAKATLSSAKWRKAVLDLAVQRRAECEVRVPEPTGWPAWSAVVGPYASPGKFTVAQRMVSVGERVQSMPLTNSFRLVMSYALKLLVNVPERHLAEIHNDQTVGVKVDAYPDVVFPAFVSRISPTIDPSNRAFPVVVGVLNAQGKLKPGGFARASIRIGEQSINVVPPQAVQTYAGVSKVFILAGDRAKAIPVTMGTSEKDWVEILGELPPNSQVITSGFSQVVDGGLVRVR